MSDQYSPCPLRGSRDNISEYHSREVYLCEAKTQERRPALWQATMGGMPRRVIWGDLSTDQHVRVTRLIHDHPRYFAGGLPLSYMHPAIGTFNRILGQVSYSLHTTVGAPALSINRTRELGMLIYILYVDEASK